LKKYEESSHYLLISGDVHYGEIMEHPCGMEKTGQQLFEITSTGLTHFTGGLVR